MAFYSGKKNLFADISILKNAYVSIKDVQIKSKVLRTIFLDQRSP